MITSEVRMHVSILFEQIFSRSIFRAVRKSPLESIFKYSFPKKYFNFKKNDWFYQTVKDHKFYLDPEMGILEVICILFWQDKILRVPIFNF